MTGTSLLQPKLPVSSSPVRVILILKYFSFFSFITDICLKYFQQQIFKRNPTSLQSNSPRSMIRMLSSSSSGKSLISPRALQPTTPPPSIFKIFF